jgi:polyphosphate kinase
VLGRFLEHSRIFCFENGGEPIAWLGSADLMHRNLDRRVEVLLRVSDETARRELAHIFEAAMAPDVKSWQLGSDADWTRTGSHDYQAERLAEVIEHAG